MADLSDKLKLYVHEMGHFTQACDEKIRTTEQTDNLNDVKIMKANIKTLMKSAKKNFL